MINFFDPKYTQTISSKNKFGICDELPPPHLPAYIDEADGQDWIAVIDNFHQDKITFIPIDNLIEIKKPDGSMDNRCDGLLFYDLALIFVELKQRGDKGSLWIKDGENQLRATITHFEKTLESKKFTLKKAYIANSKKPKFRSSQQNRMDQFLEDTGYVLRIENRIKIE